MFAKVKAQQSSPVNKQLTELVVALVSSDGEGSVS